MSSVAMYKIADTMQVPLHGTGTKDFGGSQKFHFNGEQSSFSLPFTVAARKMFSNQQTGVLFHVMGDLWTLVAYNDEHQAASLFFIDASRCEDAAGYYTPTDALHAKMTLRETIQHLGVAVVKAYARRHGAKWEPLKISL